MRCSRARPQVALVPTASHPRCQAPQCRPAASRLLLGRQLLQHWGRLLRESAPASRRRGQQRRRRASGEEADSNSCRLKGCRRAPQGSSARQPTCRFVSAPAKRAALGAGRGKPPITSPASVVVPPMSSTAAVWSGRRASRAAPRIELTGPDWKVATGVCRLWGTGRGPMGERNSAAGQVRASACCCRHAAPPPHPTSVLCTHPQDLLRRQQGAIIRGEEEWSPHAGGGQGGGAGGHHPTRQRQQRCVEHCRVLSLQQAQLPDLEAAAEQQAWGRRLQGRRCALLLVSTHLWRVEGERQTGVGEGEGKEWNGCSSAHPAATSQRYVCAVPERTRPPPRSSGCRPLQSGARCGAAAARPGARSRGCHHIRILRWP